MKDVRKPKATVSIAIDNESGVYRLMYKNKNGQTKIIRLNSKDRQDFPNIW